MRHSVFALALFVALPASQAQTVTAPTSATLTLDEAISAARQNNPIYLSTANNRRTADAAIRSARGQLLPSADASFSGRYQQGGQQVLSGVSFNSSSASVQSAYNVGLNYRVNASTFLTPRAAVANREAVEADITGSAEQLRAAVTQQYITVLQAKARASLQDTLVRTAETQLELAKAKVAVGSGTSLDIRRAEVALGQTQVALLRERNNVEIEKLRLYQQMGVPQPDSVVLVTEFPVFEPSFSLANLLDDARGQNPAIVALRARERSADLNVKVARSTYTPTLSLSTGIGGNSYEYTNPGFLVNQARAGLAASQASCFQQDSIRVRLGLGSNNCGGPQYTFTSVQEDAIRSRNNQFPFNFQRSPIGLSAVLSLPLFDNFAREERVQRAQVDKDDAVFNVRAKDLALTADVTQAYRSLTTAARTVALQEQTSAKAREELAFAEERYKVGASTFLDVVTSRGTYEQALIDRVNAIYDYHKAFAALENAVGHPLR